MVLHQNSRLIFVFEAIYKQREWTILKRTHLLYNGPLSAWASRQVDYTNAFAKAEIGATVYVEPPRLFGPKSRKYLVLLLIKSLYGLKRLIAPSTINYVKDCWSVDLYSRISIPACS
jgi:hypothetical protein